MERILPPQAKDWQSELTALAESMRTSASRPPLYERLLQQMPPYLRERVHGEVMVVRSVFSDKQNNLTAVQMEAAINQRVLAGYKEVATDLVLSHNGTIIQSYQCLRAIMAHELESELLDCKAPRVIEKEPQQSPGDVSEADTSKKQSSNTALLILPVAYIAAHDAVMKRIAQAKEVLKPRSSSASLVPPEPEPRPKKPETLPDIIPLKPLFEVSTFRQAVASKDSKDILSQRIVTYVPKAQSEKELLWEIWGRYRTQNALSPNPHMEVFLTAANAQHAAALEKVYRNMGDRIKIRRLADYDTLEKLRSIFVDAKLPGQIHFLIRQGAVVDENFLKMIYELSKVDGFIDRINVFFLVGATLQGEAGRLQSLDSLLDRRLFDLINSQA
jgi:hypothetical protein